MMVISYAIDIIKYGRSILELSNAPLRIKKDTNIIEQYTL